MIKSKLNGFEREYTFGAILIIGTLIGCFCVNEFSFDIEKYLNSVIEKSWLEIFLTALFKYFKILAMIWLFGFIKIGKVAIISILLFKGISIGSCIATFVNRIGINGAKICTLLLFPQNLILYITMIFIASVSFLYSTDKKFKINRYLFCFGICVVLAVISALVEALLCPVLLNTYMKI